MPALAEAVDHVEHIAGLAGAEHVGFGSDLDGGLTPANTPEGIERVQDLHLVLAELRRRGWSEAAVAGFAGRNWWRFFEQHLPA